jgi:hypothetical protein
MDTGFLPSILFSMFHKSGKVNRHNELIWGAVSPYIHTKVVRDSPKVNVRCGLMKYRTTGPFFFVETTATSDVYRDMLEQFVDPQTAGFQPIIMYQQKDGLPHIGVCRFEKPSRRLSESLDWARRTNFLALLFVGYHRSGPSVCYPRA